jgi:catechol 2,3-dioxygenase-like lactoylglutathione lyase family enzyme
MEWKLEVVVVPVSDIDRAKHFYGEQVGFAVDYDTQASGEIRNVQLTPPGSGCSIALTSGIVTPSGARLQPAPGSAHGLQLVVADIEAARAQLAERGVDVTGIKHWDNTGWADGRGGRWNSFIFFNDPDGNSWIVQERPSEG